MKEKYYASEIRITRVLVDIITYSETEEWEGPIISAGHDNEG